MSKEKRRVPKLRFPGFTEDWEQRKLSDISTKVTTKNVDVHYMETLTNSAEQGIISQVDFFDKEISNKDNINGYYIVENNDFIYNPRISTLAPVGPINRNKLNRTGIMSPLYTVFRASNVDLGFLEWYFQSSYWHRYMKLNGDSGARADRIAIKDSTFFDMPIKTPVNIKEQVLIGEILEKFNQYITLHQRKLNNLKLKKKALLQKLFPKNGERYPELRFPGFTDAWEQRKLTSFTQRVKGNDGRMDLPTLTISASEGWLNQKDRFSANIAGSEQKNYTLLRQGELSYNHGNSKLAKYGVVYALKDYKEALVPRVYHSFRVDESYDALFVEYYFSTKRPDRELGKLVSSGARMDGLLNIGYDEFTNISISVPTFSEQKQIVALLKVCDKYITLHQRKLDHLQLQKKALLQQMFV